MKIAYQFDRRKIDLLPVNPLSITIAFIPRKAFTMYERAPCSGGRRGEYEDFVTGFVTPEGKVWGRPVGVSVAKDGSLLFSEDGNGTIWRVSYGR